MNVVHTGTSTSTSLEACVTFKLLTVPLADREAKGITVHSHSDTYTHRNPHFWARTVGTMQYRSAAAPPGGLSVPVTSIKNTATATATAAATHATSGPGMM